MASLPLMVIVLAAGMGTRMKSNMAKVLHPIGHKPMVGHVIDLAAQMGADAMAVVIAPDNPTLEDVVRAHFSGAEIFEQKDRLGTAHAVAQAKAAFEGREGAVLVLYGDTPLLTEPALSGLLSELEAGADVGVLGFHAADATGYGRLLVDDTGALTAIREEKEASDAEKAVTFCNSGVMGFRAEVMGALLDQIGNDNAKGEYYLTDAVEVARARGLKTFASVCAEDEVLGVNDRVQLSEAESLFQARARREAQRAGCSLLAPETVYFSHDTQIGRDVIIEPHVIFGPGVVIEDGARIFGFSHLEATHIGAGAMVGPYARLRPGAAIGEGAKIGNFVEVKQADIQAGAKVNHLTYIGDAVIGSGANIGAGTITCNYDGFFKHKTVVGAGAFVGSNTSLIAPVAVGAGAYIGSSSVISEDVEADGLAVTRPERRVVPGWAKRYRAKQKAKKAAQKS